jgi:hypothetical protein
MKQYKHLFTFSFMVALLVFVSCNAEDEGPDVAKFLEGNYTGIRILDNDTLANVIVKVSVLEQDRIAVEPVTPPDAIAPFEAELLLNEDSLVTSNIAVTPISLASNLAQTPRRLAFENFETGEFYTGQRQ